MDQLCIDQNNIEEQDQEVTKMGQYYNSAFITLIAIQTKFREKECSKKDGTEFDLLSALEMIVTSE
jgi:hypothetical protein